MKLNKTIILISLALTLSIYIAFAQEKTNNSIFPDGDAIVYFYSPKCPSCQQFENEFAQFQKSSTDKIIKVIDTSKMSAEDKQALRLKHGLDKIPAIYAVNDGLIIKTYKGLEEVRKFVADRS